MTAAPPVRPRSQAGRVDPGECERCAHRAIHGRAHKDPMHCIDCHRSWTGVEAQHCLGCHRTFAGIWAADRHRWNRPKGEPSGVCVDVEADPAWHEKRPGVWTTGSRPKDIHG